MVDNEIERRDDAVTEEEILATVKKENKDYDEKERADIISAQAFGFYVGLFFVGIILLVNSIVYGTMPVEVMLLYSASYGAYGLAAGIKLKGRHKKYLIFGIIFICIAVAYLVLWILQLTGTVSL